jgi:hypothetical protein
LLSLPVKRRVHGTQKKLKELPPSHLLSGGLVRV